MLNVCGRCEYAIKNPHESGWRCVYSFANARDVEYDDTCQFYKPRNRCRTCRYESRPLYEEPCDSCCHAHDGYKPIEE